MTPLKRIAASTAALIMIGGMPAVATAQAERTIAPEDIDAYIKEFEQDPHVTPVVDGVGGISDTELAEYHDLVRATQAAGNPETKLVPGEMWSDTVGLPPSVDKADADAAEIAIATEQHALPSIDTLGTLDAQTMVPAAAHCKTFLFSPHQVCGAILERYEALGGLLSWLMHPIEPMHLNPDGQGYRQRFQNGFIYWHPATGAHAVTVRNANVWERNGWEQGWLGYPLGGEVPVKGNTPADGELNGWVQLFQGGRMYRTPLAQGAHVASINGLILDKWLDLGGPDSDLGFPLADEAKTADSVGRFSVFQHGSIYWHPNHGAWEVSGLFYEIWADHGYEAGEFGYPLSDSYFDDNYRHLQRFDGQEMDLNIALSDDQTINIGGVQVSRYFASMLERRGVPLESFPDLTWSSTLEQQKGIQTESGGPESAHATQSGTPPWRACGYNSSPDKVIKSWTGQYGKHRGRIIDLKCGTKDGDGDGYFHIKKSHHHEWRAKASIEGIGWTEVADMAITKSLTAAEMWKNDREKDTTCYSGQIYLVNKRTGTIAEVLHPSVFVSNRNDRIVTAFTAPKCKSVR